MLDFNTKKEILRRLKTKRGKNKLLWLPCVIAELFVKLWYAFLCRAGLALSDKNGKFLGLAKPKEKTGVRRQDDIVYVKRPFWGRVMSAVLAASFVLMFVPELGISFEVSAVSSTATEAKDPDGKSLWFYRDSDGGNIAYLKEDYEAAVGKDGKDGIHVEIKIDDIGYGAFTASWVTKYSDGSVMNESDIERKIHHYKVRVYKSGDNPTWTEVSNTASGLELPTDISSLKLGATTDYTIAVVPVVNVQKWSFTAKDEAAGIENNTVQMILGSFEQFDGTVKSSKVNRLNATLPKPKISPIADVTDGVENPSVKILWNEVYQQGGNASQMDESSKKADGYKIYRSEAGGSWSEIADVGNDRIDQDTGKLYYIDSGGELKPGRHYQYFIEAYKVIWGEPGYDKDNPGMISSSGSDVSKPADGKASAYEKADLFIAPSMPVMTITPKVNEHSIDVGWDFRTSGADGVFLWRSDRRIPDEEWKNKNYKSLRDYLMAVYNGLEVSGLKFLINPASNVKAYEDKEVASGKDYYYYLISYMNKTGTGGGILYSDPRVHSSNMNLHLDPPTINKVEPQDGKISIGWTSVEGADGYILHVEKLKDYKGNSVPEAQRHDEFDLKKATSFVHETFKGEKLLNGEQYRYYVIAYANVKTASGENVTSNKSYDRVETVGISLSTPQGLKATPADGTINVSWEAVKGAEGYLLYYKYDKKGGDSSEFSDKVCFDVSKPSYPHLGLNNGDKYTYHVRAYKTVNGERVYSPMSDDTWAIVGVPLDAPKDLTGTTKDGLISLKWTASKGAEGYEIFYRKNDGSWEEDSFDVSKPGFQHTNLNNRDIYEYYIIAYKTVNGERVYSDESNHIRLRVGDELSAPKDFTGTTKDGTVDLKWTAVKGAEGYILYFRRNGGAWEEVDVSKPGFQHVGLNNGDRYEYYVKSYKTVNGERLLSFDESNHLNFKIGDDLESPKDFNAVTTDGQVSLTWTAVRGAEGYIVYAYGSGRSYQFDVSKPGYVHTGLLNGDSWTYYVVAYKTVNGIRIYSSPTKSITVTTGVSLNSVIDLVATAGNRQIDLSWTAVKGAEGYVVYLYNTRTMEFEPITVISGTKYSHTGLKNGQKYTYMVAPYKTINGERFYGEYSMSVSATPSTGSNTDIDNMLTVRGTTPYGISHSEYITAGANHGAFDEPVDVYFTTNRESTEAVRDVLKNYADGLSSFIIYPFDISIYREDTKIEVDPNPGYNVTITMPIPDRLIAYRDYITVVHIGDGMEDTEEITAGDAEDWIRTADTTLEVLPCAIVDVDNIWCVQFVCSSFSPYALVIYKDHISDVSSGGGILDGDFAGSFNSGVLLFTALPDIMPHNKKLKVVQGGKKRYRIKSVEKK